MRLMFTYIRKQYCCFTIPVIVPRHHLINPICRTASHHIDNRKNYVSLNRLGILHAACYIDEEHSAVRVERPSRKRNRKREKEEEWRRGPGHPNRFSISRYTTRGPPHPYFAAHARSSVPRRIVFDHLQKRAVIACMWPTRAAHEVRLCLTFLFSGGVSAVPSPASQS